MSEEYYQLNLGKYFRIIYRWKWLVVLCLCGSIVLSLLKEKSRVPLYQASVSFWVRGSKMQPGVLSEKVMQFLFIGQENPLAADYGTQMTIMKSAVVLDEVVKKLGLPSKTKETLNDSINQIRSCVSVSVLKASSIIEVVAIHSSPEMAVKIADAVYEAYMKFNNELYLEQEQRRLKSMEEQARLVREEMGKNNDLITEKIQRDMYLLLMEKIATANLNLSLGQSDYVKIIDKSPAINIVPKRQALRMVFMGIMGVFLGAVLALGLDTLIGYKKKGV